MAATALHLSGPQHQGNWDGRDANLVYGKDDLLNKTSLLKCSQS